MVYETSYESGRKPFRPDNQRGNWASPADYLYACLAFSFRFDLFSVQWALFPYNGIMPILGYLLCTIPYVVPLLAIQSFVGQFSSSGFISAFRLSPFFKGIGYVSLALNVFMLIYHSIFTAIPLLFFFHSMRFTLPWSCATPQYWANLSKDEEQSICNATEKASTNSNESIVDFLTYHVPSKYFFGSIFNGPIRVDYEVEEYYISWQLMFFNLMTWGILAIILHKFFHPNELGKVLRYLFWTIIGLLAICLLRFCFLPSAWKTFKYFFASEWIYFGLSFSDSISFTALAFGPGWGAVIAMSSLNKFRTNTLRYNWYAVLGQVLIITGIGLTVALLEQHLYTFLPTEKDSIHYIDSQIMLLISGATALADLEYSNLWCLLYYAMLTCGSIYSIIVQLYSLLISIFDEFEKLRDYKKEVTLGILGFLAFTSLFFCSTYLFQFPLLSIDSMGAQLALNLMLIIVVLWVYGRERFQRDIQFMIGEPFATWKIFMIRFIPSLIIVLLLPFLVIAAFMGHIFSTGLLWIIAVLLILMPWLCVPAYGLYFMLLGSGPLKVRFKRCTRPTDWYPVDPEERQRYEEEVDNADITHQLNEIRDDAI